MSVEDLFHAVADLPAEARTRYFARLEIDERTRQEVEALIHFDSQESLSLHAPIRAAANRALTAFDVSDILCGPYRLIELLGRGGMGSVYLAERVDGEIRQRVAVKLLRPGAQHSLLRERFLAERQILASLSHPNIARLLDAGHRENGQPYFVMEYVEGQPIDEYTADLAIRRKITLFLKACAAVGYLHRNLVVHRDLKPSNILVAVEGEPKLVDFGIARELDLTDGSAATTMRILTPSYASPEQVAGTSVTTATDIYSLGAVLYRLLTGASPHEFEGSSADAIVSSICEGGITPPSRRTPALKGDLETILMKALRKEPRERYETVEQFSEDLQSYLESGPIRARKDDVWYRARKFLRRHWASAAGTALVITSLSTGLYIANRQRIIAERRFGELRQLSKRMIDLDGAIRVLPGSVEARRRLVSASLEYLQGLSRDAAGDLDLARETADGYWRMARIQGVPAEFNLGDPTTADDSLNKADHLIEIVLASRPKDRNALLRYAVIAHDRMIVANSNGRRSEAIAWSRKTIERLEAFTAVNNPGDPVHMEGFLREGDRAQSEAVGAALLYTNVALADVNVHLYSDGARYAARAVRILRPIPRTSNLLAQSLSLLANAQRYQGNVEAAFNTIHEARETSEHATYGDDTERFFNLYGLLNREALILGEPDAINLQRPEEAIGLFGRALDLAEDAARKNPHDFASRDREGGTARQLGQLLRDRDPRRSLEVFDLGILRLREAGASLSARRDQSALLALSSYSLRGLGRRKEAKDRIDAAFAILKETKDYPSDQIRLEGPARTAVSALADYEADGGRVGLAIEMYEQLLDRIMAAKPEPMDDLRDAPKVSRVYRRLAGLYVLAGNVAAADAINSRRAALWHHWQEKMPSNVFIRQQLASVSTSAE